MNVSDGSFEFTSNEAPCQPLVPVQFQRFTDEIAALRAQVNTEGENPLPRIRAGYKFVFGNEGITVHKIDSKKGPAPTVLLNGEVILQGTGLTSFTGEKDVRLEDLFLLAQQTGENASVAKSLIGETAMIRRHLLDLTHGTTLNVRKSDFL